MRRIWKYMIGAAVALQLTACVEEIDLEELRPDPTLVVNCVAQAGKPLEVGVSHTWFFTDDHQNVPLEDAEVNLYVNDSFREKLWFEEGETVYNMPGQYHASYVPREGDRIHLEVSHPEFGKAQAETVVPKQAKVLKANIHYLPEEGSGYGRKGTILYQVTIRDDNTRDNYYLLRIDRAVPVFDRKAKQYIGFYDIPLYIDYTTDPIFGSTFTALDQIFGSVTLQDDHGVIFSDELLNGKAEYTFQLRQDAYSTSPGGNVYFINVGDEELSPDEYEPAPSCRLWVHLYEISADYYKYLKALQEQDSGVLTNALIDAGLAEPIRVFSNVDGGVGIVGSCNPYLFE